MKNRLNRDWQIERKQMQDELLHLREENAQLKDLLCQHGITIPQSQKSLPPEVVQPIHTIPNKVNTLRPLTPKEKIDIFRGLFRGREDVFARRWYSTTLNKGGYQPVCQREWDVEFCNKKKYRCANCPNRQFAPLTYNDIYCHLQGKDELGRDVIGLYVVMQDNTCYLLCADFDDKSCEHGYKNDVLSFTQVCQDWGIPYAIERSRSGNGAHVWIFFDTPILASKARKLGFSIISEAMNRNGRMTFRSYDRFFPNQDRLPEGGLGNLVALPLQGKARHNNNSVFVDEHFEPHFDQWAYLLSIKRLQETIIDDLIAQHGQSHELGELTSSSENKPWELPKQVSLSTDDFLQTIQITRADRLYIPLESISSKLLNHLKRIAAFKNPDFYNRLAMRLSIQNTPRIISCADVLENYIALPRGCEDAVFALLQHWLAPYEVQDKTNAGRKIPVEFVGELRDDQQHAISTLRNYNNGVLSATTVFGKTVAVAALIAKRKVNTLILVHSKALLLQWKSILERFLLIDAQPENTSHRRGRKKFSHQSMS